MGIIHILFRGMGDRRFSLTTELVTSQSGEYVDATQDFFSQTS